MQYSRVSFGEACGFHRVATLGYHRVHVALSRTHPRVDLDRHDEEGEGAGRGAGRGRGADGTRDALL